ncbi:STM3941 family protein [Pedobacter helvus]|uniref:STM3941 family protein n=1 Tax=Pedobacter helvus TaxID=2563444 RepID=A0ABW9JNZ7_9SPHI|nr:STM3941 family protein [Pedobacter ureilyticus]
MIEIKLYKRPLKALKIFALTTPFVATGIWMINKEPVGTTNYIMGWFSTCFFGLGIPVGLFQLLDRRPQVIINENGIWDRTTKQDVIKWEQIESAYPLDIYKQKFVCLVLDETFEMKKNLYKWAAKLNEGIGAQKVNLMVSQLKIDEHKMTKFINEIVKTEKQNRQTIIKKYFDH